MVKKQTTAHNTMNRYSGDLEGIAVPASLVTTVEKLVVQGPSQWVIIIHPDKKEIIVKILERYPLQN